MTIKLHDIVKSYEDVIGEYEQLFLSLLFAGAGAAIFWLLAKVSSISPVFGIIFALPAYVFSVFLLGHMVFRIFGQKDHIFKLRLMAVMVLALVLITWSVKMSFIILGLMYIAASIHIAWKVLVDTERVDVQVLSAVSALFAVTCFIWEVGLLTNTIPTLT